MIALPGLVLVALVPIAMGAVAAGRASSRAAFGIAVAGALVPALASALLLVPGHDFVDPWTGGAVGLSAHGRVGLPLAAFLGLAVLLARPATWRDPRQMGALLATEGLVLLMVLAREIDLFCAAWVASFVPALARRAHRKVSRRPVAITAVLSSLPVAAAWAVARLGGGAGAIGAGAAPLPTHLQGAVFVLLFVAMAARMGILPFSPLFVAMIERDRLGRSVLLAALRPSVLLALVVAEPLCPDGAARWAEPLAWLGVLTAIAGGLHGIAQTGPRRALASIGVTQSGLIFAGLCAAGPSGNAGAAVQWVALGVSMIGMALVLESIEARLGRREAARARGLMGPLPGLSLVFLVYGATATGFPATLGFIGEDLVVSALHHHGLAAAVLALAATALNGATLVMLFSRTFLGPVAPEHHKLPTMVLRERWVLVPLAIVLAATGIFPERLIEAVGGEERGSEVEAPPGGR